jgi:hypothetical protein
MTTKSNLYPTRNKKLTGCTTGSAQGVRLLLQDGKQQQHTCNGDIHGAELPAGA